MNRNTVDRRRHQAGLARCSNKKADQNFGPGGQAGVGAQRDHGLEGRQRLGPEPDRVQLPQRRWRRGQRDLVERRRAAARSAATGCWARTSTLRARTSRASGPPRPYGDLHEQLDRRHVGPDLRQQLQRLGLLHRRLPSGRATRRSTTRWAEFNALGYSGSNSGGRLLVENSEFDNNEDGFDTNSQNGDNPPPQNGACPTRRQPPVAGAPTVLGVHPQLRPRQQQPQRPGGGLRGRRPGRHRHVGVGRAQRHDHEQPLRQQQRVGRDPRRRIPTAARRAPAAPRTRRAGQGQLPVRRVGRPRDQQHVHAQRGLRKPDERRLRAAEPRDAPERLLQRQCRHVRRAEPGRRPRCSRLTRRARRRRWTATQHPVPQRGAVRLEASSSSRSGASPATTTRAVTQVVMHTLPKHLATMPNPCKGVPANPWCKAQQGQQGQGQGY